MIRTNYRTCKVTRGDSVRLNDSFIAVEAVNGVPREVGRLARRASHGSAVWNDERLCFQRDAQRSQSPNHDTASNDSALFHFFSSPALQQDHGFVLTAKQVGSRRR